MHKINDASCPFFDFCIIGLSNNLRNKAGMQIPNGIKIAAIKTYNFQIQTDIFSYADALIFGKTGIDSRPFENESTEIQ